MANDDRTPLFTRGDEMRRQILGDAWVDRSWADADDTIQTFLGASTELLWGGIWTRDGLDLKYRSLVTVVILAVLGRQKELKPHLIGALRLGWTPQELQEAMLHVATYAGYPQGLEAMRVVSETLAQETGARPAR